jgi:phage terminase large subunit
MFAEMLVERCLMDTTRAMCIREHQVSLKSSVKQLIEDKIKYYGLGSYFRILNTHIEIPDNDGLIVFQGMKNHTADSVKSFEGFDIAWIEEAQSFTRRSLDLLRPTIRKPGSEIWASWNPRRKTDPVDEFFADGKNPDIVCVHSTFRDNPFLPDVLLADLKYDRKRDLDRYLHVWEGGYDNKTNRRVFTNWRIGDHLEFEKITGTLLFGSDFGFASSPTVLLRCIVSGRTLYITHEAYKLGCEIDHTPALFNTVPDANKHPIICDGSRPETISYLRRNGYKGAEPAKKGPDSIIEGVSFLKSYDIVVHPRCHYTIDELNNYAWKVDPLTDEVLPELEDDNNHVIDAARYAVERLRRARGGVF